MRSAARSMRRGARLAVFASRVTCRLRRVADERLADVQRTSAVARCEGAAKAAAVFAAAVASAGAPSGMLSHCSLSRVEARAAVRPAACAQKHAYCTVGAARARRTRARVRGFGRRGPRRRWTRLCASVHRTMPSCKVKCLFHNKPQHLASAVTAASGSNPAARPWTHHA